MNLSNLSLNDITASIRDGSRFVENETTSQTGISFTCTDIITTVNMPRDNVLSVIETATHVESISLTKIDEHSFYVRCVLHAETVQNLLPFQEDMLNAIVDAIANNTSRFQVLAGTGSGKSTTLPYVINRLATEQDKTRFIIFVPRINLADQLCESINVHLEKLGVKNEYNLVPIHSGKYVPVEDNCFPPTTNEALIAERVMMSGKTITICTYDSSSTLADAMGDESFDVAFYDEAHNLSSNRKFTNLVARPTGELVTDYKTAVELYQTTKDDFTSMKVKLDNGCGKLDKTLERRMTMVSIQLANITNKVDWEDYSSMNIAHHVFMTATQTSGLVRGHRGMDINLKVFGEITFALPFSDLASSGYLVKPELIEISKGSDVKLEGFDSRQDRIRKEIQYLIKATTYTYRELDRVKMIMYVSNIDKINALSNTYWSKVKGWIEDDLKANGAGDINLQVFGLHSGMTPDQQAREVLDFKESNNAIMINCMMLSEGVDFPDANSILTCRLPRSVEASQMIGRISRIDTNDFKRILDGSLTPNGMYTGYVKQKALLFLPLDLHSNDTHAKESNDDTKIRIADFKATFNATVNETFSEISAFGANGITVSGGTHEHIDHADDVVGSLTSNDVNTSNVKTKTVSFGSVSSDVSSDELQGYDFLSED